MIKPLVPAGFRSTFAFSLILLLLLCCHLTSQAQGFFKKYINKLVNDTTDITQPQFIYYPTLAYTPETSWEVGFSSLYVFYHNKDTTNRLSELSGFTFVTFENQYGVWLDHAIYTQENKWYMFGRTRFQSFPLLYYGIGPNTTPEYVARVDAQQVFLKQRALRQVAKNLFFGGELDYQSIHKVAFVPADVDVGVELPRGASGSSNLGLGLGLVYDNRHNVLNVRHGFFSELAVLNYRSWWGSSFDFNTIISDTRMYRPVGRNNVLAAQVLGIFTQHEVPFNQKALLGGESMMRGYYTGRYRDKNLLAAQVEMRFLPLPLGFTDRFGAVVFGSLGSVFDRPKSFDIQGIVWSAGFGGRFLLFPKKDIYTRFDVAFTTEGTGYYLYIGEAF